MLSTCTAHIGHTTIKPLSRGYYYYYYYNCKPQIIEYIQ